MLLYKSTTFSNNSLLETRAIYKVILNNFKNELYSIIHEGEVYKCIRCMKMSRRLK